MTNRKYPLYQSSWESFIFKKNDNEIEKMLTNGVDFNQKDSFGNTLLHEVVRSQEGTSLLKKLIEWGADVNVQNKAGWTPLHIAVANNFYKKTKLLLEAGADVNVKIEEYEDDTALHLASWKNNGKIAQLLISNGANLNIHGEEGTPLKTAFYLRAYDVARVIIKEMRKRKEITLAEGKELPKIPEPEKKQSQSPNFKQEKEFEKEIKRQVLRGELDVNSKDERGVPLLNRAVSKGTVDLVKFLIKKGAKVNVCDDQEWTPLHWAAANCSYEKAKALLDNGADIHAKIQGQETATHITAWFDDIRLMKLMISHGGNLNDDTGEQGTPLQTASYFRKFKMMRFLENYSYQKRLLEIKQIEDYKKLSDRVGEEKARKISAQQYKKRMRTKIGRERL